MKDPVSYAKECRLQAQSPGEARKVSTREPRNHIWWLHEPSGCGVDDGLQWEWRSWEVLKGFCGIK